MPKTDEIDKQVAFLCEILSCNYPLSYWCYDEQGELLDTNCQELVYSTIFAATGCKDYLVSYGKEDDAPLVLSAPMGLMWCAAFEKRGETLHRAHLLGPIFSNEVSVRGLEQGLRAVQIPISWKSTLIRLLTQLPVIASITFFQSALMLHYCVTGEKRQTSDIRFQKSGVELVSSDEVQKKDRHQTWMAEQALLRMVREGDMNYKSAMARAHTVSSGVPVEGRDPMMQAKISQVVFTSLCTRAAIEGGLTPENAYARGDAYIQSVMDSTTISEIADIGHTMYEDFIGLVHKCRTNPIVSKQVQSCCDYIEMHVDEKLPLAYLANRVGYTEYYLSRKFKREMGVNINDYIKFAKIERAKMLLTTTTNTILAVNDALCFGTRSYFTDTFKTIVGCSPAEYRKKHQRL